MSDFPHVRKIAYSVPMSREVALLYGIVEPTPEEAAEQATAKVEYEARVRAAWAVYDEARPALAAITDPVARLVLDLHSSETIEHPKCRGCDIDGMEAETPEWPCRTVQAVADHYGIELPSALALWQRPDAQ